MPSCSFSTTEYLQWRVLTPITRHLLQDCGVCTSTRNRAVPVPKGAPIHRALRKENLRSEGQFHRSKLQTGREVLTTTCVIDGGEMFQKVDKNLSHVSLEQI